MTNENPFKFYSSDSSREWVDETVQQFCEAVKQNPNLSATAINHRHGKIEIHVSHVNEDENASCIFASLFWDGSSLRTLDWDRFRDSMIIEDKNELVVFLTNLFMSSEFSVILERMSNPDRDIRPYSNIVLRPTDKTLSKLGGENVL